LTAEKHTGRRLWRLHTKTTVSAEVPVLFVHGRLDHATSSELEAAVSRQTPDKGGDIHIDLSGVDYLSSAGLKVFERLSSRLSQNGGRLRLRAPSVAARLALEFAGLLRLVDG
jgi:anti-anti-sigma factor